MLCMYKTTLKISNFNKIIFFVLLTQQPKYKELIADWVKFHNE